MEAHTSALAFYSPLALSIACLLAGGVWLMLWSRARVAYMLLAALPWWAFCAYFALLAISAGSAPVLTRGDIAETLRDWGLVVALLIVAGKFVLLRAWWRNGKARRDST